MAQSHLCRPIKRLLVANRGEIASRILTTARDLSIPTLAISTTDDGSHTILANARATISSPATFMSVDALVNLAREHECDAVHPGYGFLSESAEFAARMAEAGVLVVGPGQEILERTGDKLAARALAEECGVPVLPALTTPTGAVVEIRRFAGEVGLPVMIKARDGGGGRGIRLVRDMKSLESAAKRALEESPSKQVFAEKAAVDGFRHVEVQVVGDGKGNVQHLWERECSIQRRYQKVVEVAPSTVRDRGLIEKVIASAMSMARNINYLSLGTFEFLVNPMSKEFYFLEVNPRLQVEHTITESIAMVDLVKIQLEIAQGASLMETDLAAIRVDLEIPPRLHSIQLRLTAENVRSNWTLSIGRITSYHFPSGNGVRVDTHLVNGLPAVVSADYDSLIAKIIITGINWEDVVKKAGRALADTHVEGVKTNIDILRGIVASNAFRAGECDTSWLESHVSGLCQSGEDIAKASSSTPFAQMLAAASSGSASSMPSVSSSNVLLRKGDAWSITISPASGASAKTLSEAVPHHLKLLKVLRNEFPSSLAAEITYATPESRDPTPLRIELSSTSASSSALMSSGTHRRGDPRNPNHVVIPFPGKLVEVLVDEGDHVTEGDVVCVVQQMKMELEVRATRGGRLKWVIEAEDGEDVAEGSLAAEVEDAENAELRPKL